jgi:S1-C subfamily serine protease
MKKYFTWAVVGVLLLTVLGCQLSALPSFNQFTIQNTNTPDTAVPAATVQPEDTQAPAAQDNPGTVQVKTGDLVNTQDTLVNLFKQVGPGVVSIDIITSQGDAAGSGFVYDKQGHIITNYHVVQDAQDLVVNFPSGLKVRGKVLATDTDSDIAVIKVDVPANQLKPLPLGDSDALQVGMMVVAIGNPYRLSSSMTLGIVSAKGRILDSIRTTADGQSFSAGDLIQTDASINPGNSGGPLLNLNGEVVGINRAIQTNGMSPAGEPINTGIGFAVSVNVVKRVVPVLIKNGKYDYPYLGLTALPEMTLFVEEALGLSHSTGAYVVQVVPGGPVDKAGLQAGTQPTNTQGLNAGGDLIVGVDGRPVQVYGDLVGYLFTNKSPGDTITLTVLRNGKQVNLKVVLGKRP